MTSDMPDFGTIEELWCFVCCKKQSDKRRHVLGGDDEWYCERCEKHHFDAIVAYYVK